MTKILRILFFALISTSLSYAQKPQKPNSSDIYEAIKKLNFLGSVLYVAAHPDDENTRLISYYANGIKARTAYLSLTRGDGGQNLIGPEIRELLGVIRTQELLAARRIDGGEQLFTRANDFGYSKHPDETFAIWNKEAVLSDVVLAIRRFQPDIIINRFDHRSQGRTHGHHTGSALLSLEAFELANQASVYPKQLDSLTTWQPKRLLFNTSWWFYGSQEKFDEADKSNLIGIETGTYYPSKGLSNPEIAALSRSQHKSQGFGNTGSRGSAMEYLELIKGTMPNPPYNLFDGIDTTWNRLKGGAAIGTLLKQVEAQYDFKNPAASIPQLVAAYKAIQALENSTWKTVKLKEIKAVIAACAGLFLEVVAETNQVTSNQTVVLSLEAINRSKAPITLESYTNANGIEKTINSALVNNKKLQITDSLLTPDANKSPITTPYWLTQKGTLGMYKVPNSKLIGKPETPSVFQVTFQVTIAGTTIPFTKPIVYKTNDPVKGEVYKPFEIIPEAAVKIAEKVIIFDTENSKQIPVIVKAGRANISGNVHIEVPEGWLVSPKNAVVTIQNKGAEETILFSITPPKNNSEGYIKPAITIQENIYTNELIEIDYNHIPFQTVLLPSESKVVRLNISKKGKNIAYIAGAGDMVPESLQQIGYQVTILEPDAITAKNLQNFDAVVLGIRAYNTVETLKFKQAILFDFVKNGGNMIVQYNTSHELVTNKLAPFPLQLSRNRVTNEAAAVTFVAPHHPVLNEPNKITQADFENWTQERGLYFPDSWGSQFTPILSMQDKGETPKLGSLLVAKYGKGYYVYTGLSFFREFPAGVSGAYRLFANMLSLGN
ncbi:PIG-L family deacetylase [Bizionia sediminis]|uniref:PIG-L family deacetylase n=1 Tax=Bizionia sediminis TaxID=1737064 RepID=A0ABW5KNU5_9FLAO